MSPGHITTGAYNWYIDKHLARHIWLRETKHHSEFCLARHVTCSVVKRTIRQGTSRVINFRGFRR